MNRNLHLVLISFITWIEKLLVNHIDDYRKNAIALILAPYLMNIKKASYDSAFTTIAEWLKRCNSLKNLDFDITNNIRAALLQAAKKSNSSNEIGHFEIKK
jgi:hypothetical protein